MTATRPEGPPPPPLFLSAQFCADRMPVDELTLCRRLKGHAGEHQSDGQDAWGDGEREAG